MADLLAELEGFLGKAEADKIRANPVAVERLTRASEVVSFYDGDTETPPAPPVRREPAPPTVRPATGAGDETFAQIMARLDSFGNIDEKIKVGVETIVTARGNELVNNAIAISMRNTRELSKIDARHRAEFGEEMDDAKLEAHVAAAKESGRPFRTITEAYDDMTREARFKKDLDTGVKAGVREELQTRASAGTLPGVTPRAATPMLSILRKAATPSGTSGAGTHTESAARALEARLAERGEQVA